MRSAVPLELCTGFWVLVFSSHFGWFWSLLDWSSSMYHACHVDVELMGQSNLARVLSCWLMAKGLGLRRSGTQSLHVAFAVRWLNGSSERLSSGVWSVLAFLWMP